MAVFRRLVYTALCAALVAGFVAALAHQLVTVPLILKAEGYERAAQHAAGEAHDHVAAAPVEPAAEEWLPQNGVERALYTFLADLLAAIGFGLLLAAGLTLSGAGTNWRQGLLWGLAGFATFTLAPGIGLPPELPGSDAAPLALRQLWWLFAALSTGGALALLAFGRRAAYVVLALVLLVLPHLVGAPEPEGAGAAPPDLAHRFAVLATVTSLLFWLALGAATGHFYRRFAPRAV
jgi:cobalt transporter subunit CbtA